MTKKQQAHALQIAMHLRSRAQIASTPGNLDTLSASAANELERQHARIAELEDDLQFVERWAVHHGSKPSISAEEALSCIQHYPAIHEITKSYKDGKSPDTFNPYARIAELEAARIAYASEFDPDENGDPDVGSIHANIRKLKAQLESIGAGGVEPLRKPAAPQAVQAAVPDGWKLVPVVATYGMLNAMHGVCSETGKPMQSKIDKAEHKYASMLAAAPQPPEAHAHPAESVPAQIETLRSELAEEKEAADNWRRLALQFDIHRLQALWHLKRILHADSSVDEYKAAEQFLAAPPLDGEAVLAQRIAALAATQPAAQVMDADSFAQTMSDWAHGDSEDAARWRHTIAHRLTLSPRHLRTDEEVCADIDAAIAAQANQGGA